MHQFLKKIHKLAQKNPQKIVYPEGTEERILRATEVVVKKKIAHLTLIGPEKNIKANAKKLDLEIDWKQVEIIDPNNSPLTKKFAKSLFELRKEKGLTQKDATKLVHEMNYFGTMLVHQDLVDGMVTGTTFSTADSIRPALQIIKTKDKFHKVSGVFFLFLEKKMLLFADTAITIEPNSYELADIAIDTAMTAKKFGIDPRVALLSFSTKGSANHPNIDKMREAVAMIKDRHPEILVDGELQFDAALVPDVAQRKCPQSPLEGKANVLIFPNLEAANIAYKVAERLSKAKAVGPILQGLKKPINDLSRGCHFQDIVDITAFTVCECQD